MTGAASSPGDAPDAAALTALSSDDWAALLVAARTELRARAELPADLAALRDTPTGRLVSGTGRERVIAALQGEPGLWRAIADRLPEGFADQLTSVPDTEVAAAGAQEQTSAQLREELERVRARARALREERDTWQRRAEGADARAARAEAGQRTAEEQLRAVQDELEHARGELAQAEAAREHALERHQRRRDSERDRLARENADLRRREQQRLAADRRRAEQQQRETAHGGDRDPDVPVPRIVPGRPTRLPRGLVPGTTEWARALLGPGRRVLIDGYNVTRQHQRGRDLEGQRDWLLQLLVNAVAVHRWRPLVVFDGQQASGRLPPAGRHRVEVRFTAAGITADDELVLAVEGTDEPVVVVTDDRELRDRVRAADADVVGTTAFLSVARG